jgi:NADH-quinone oxidoreductase subunit G
MKKSLGYNNVNDLRESINKYIQSKKNEEVKKTSEFTFIEENISLKPIDYYYTNPIARSSKVMNECRQISKRFLFTGVEKAS